MKEITIHTFNGEEKVRESKLVIEDRETLVVRTPDGFGTRQSVELHKTVERVLKGGSPILTIPKGVEFKVIKVQ